MNHFYYLTRLTCTRFSKLLRVEFGTFRLLQSSKSTGFVWPQYKSQKALIKIGLEIWSFTLVFFLFLLFRQRLLFHFIDEDAAVGSGVYFLMLLPSEIWVAEALLFLSWWMFSRHCTHQTWTATYNNSVSFNMYSVKINLNLLREAPLTSKTCNSLKVSHVTCKINVMVHCSLVRTSIQLWFLQLFVVVLC